MANTQLQQWIVTQLNDKNWGSHHKVKIFNPETNTNKEADWLWLYANKKAIIIEDKESGDTGLKDAITQVRKYQRIIKAKGYDDIITIAIKDKGLTKEVKVFRNDKLIERELKTINYYEILLGAKNQTDISSEIYRATAEINQLLHDEFKILILNDRMLFTGCVLVASKFGDGNFSNYAGIEGFKTLVSQKISSLFTQQEKRQMKVNKLLGEFQSITIGAAPSNELIKKLCEICNRINELLRDNPLSDIDIMNIFFTEFNRYGGKRESGQVFTPDHIADLMAKLLKIKNDDHILDPTCGSGSLLLKCSKYNDKNFDNIFGNDLLMNVLRLSYINMLLHNDGITNLMQFDARDETLPTRERPDPTFVSWVRASKITKVIANPPYERTFAIDILLNVLENVKNGCQIVWLMPNMKLMAQLTKENYRKLFSRNQLTDIIFLGDIFPKTGCGDVSLFLFTKGTPQGDNLIKCWHIDDQFETVKNQGYQDVKGTWPKILQQFMDDFENDNYDCVIDPKKQLNYPKRINISNLSNKDFEMTILQYRLFQYGSISSQNSVQSTLKLIFNYLDKHNSLPKTGPINTSTWSEFKLSDLFKIEKCKGTKKSLLTDGKIPYVARSAENNGVTNYCGNANLVNPANSITIHAEWKDTYCAFYQKNEYVTDGMIACLSSEKLTENIGLFVATILSKVKYDGTGLKESLNNVYIKLPSKDGQPDWEYMETYVAGCETESN